MFISYASAMMFSNVNQLCNQLCSQLCTSYASAMFFSYAHQLCSSVMLNITVFELIVLVLTSYVHDSPSRVQIRTLWEHYQEGWQGGSWWQPFGIDIELILYVIYKSRFQIVLKISYPQRPCGDRRPVGPGWYESRNGNIRGPQFQVSTCSTSWTSRQLFLPYFIVDLCVIKKKIKYTILTNASVLHGKRQSPKGPMGPGSMSI